MNSFVRRWSLLGLLSVVSLAGEAAAVAPPPSAATDPTAASAEAAVDEFHAALRRGDTAAALALLPEDALVFEEGGAEWNRAEYESHHLAADSAFSKAVPATITRRVARAAGDSAWVATETRAKGTFRGNAVDRIVKETMVLRREAGGWRIVHIHWSSRDSSVE
jgi:ketosteroid isomerase-like protein